MIRAFGLFAVTVCLAGCSALTEPRAPVGGNALIPEARSNLFRKSDDSTSTPIATVTAADLDRRPGGAILRVTGRSQTAGAYGAVLIADTEAARNGTLVISVEAEQPTPETASTGSAAVQAGLWLSDQTLAGLDRIVLQAAENSLELRP